MASNKLEREFNKAMIHIYERARDEADYLATRFIKMVNEHGGLETARILINANKPSDGYSALWERKRLDITVEALVQDPKWAFLFTPDEINRAKQRLIEYGYDFKC